MLDEIETLEGELAYWDRQADVAWSQMIAADIRLSDARDRVSAEQRRQSAAQPSDVGVPAHA